MTVGVWMLRKHSLADHLHFRERLSKGNARTELPHDAEPRRAGALNGSGFHGIAREFMTDGGWDVGVDFAQLIAGPIGLRKEIAEGGRQNPHHGERMPFDRDRLADDSRVGAKFALIELPCQYRNIGVVTSKYLAKRWFRIRDGPEIALNRADPLCARLAVIHHRVIVITHERHTLERVRLLAIHQIVSARDHAITAGKRAVLGDPGEPFRIGIGHWLKKHRMNYAKHRGVHSDPQSESQDRDRGESRILPKDSERVSQILRQMIQPDEPPDVPHFFLNARNIAERAERGEPGLVWLYPAIHILLRLTPDVVLDIEVKALQHPLATPDHRSSLRDIAGDHMPPSGRM